jgi:hypothetical protein
MFIVENDKPEALPHEDWGHFFSEDLYIVDLKGAKHRYVLMWMGPKLEGEAHT